MMIERDMRLSLNVKNAQNNKFPLRDKLFYTDKDKSLIACTDKECPLIGQSWKCNHQG